MTSTLSNVEPQSKQLLNQSLPFQIHRIIEEGVDKGLAADIEKHSKSEGPNSDIVQALNALAVTQNAGAIDALEELVTQIRQGKVLLASISDDEVMELSSERGIASREIGQHRRGKVTQLIKAGPCSAEELGMAVHLKDKALDQFLATILQQGIVTKVGDKYGPPNA